jgi:hypothetical protein
VETDGLSIGSNLGSDTERMDPVSPVAEVQGQLVPEDEQNKQRRRSPPAETPTESPTEPDTDRTQHRVDDIA